eukprot:1482465-Pleurochrysis_carterae.AAC.3
MELWSSRERGSGDADAHARGQARTNARAHPWHACNGRKRSRSSGHVPASTRLVSSTARSCSCPVTRHL